MIIAFTVVFIGFAFVITAASFIASEGLIEKVGIRFGMWIGTWMLGCSGSGNQGRRETEARSSSGAPRV